MQAGRTIAAGAPEDVLKSEHLAGVYGIDARYATIEGVPVVLVADVLP
jgi:ABC-type hemin transport system ATPase subunit